MAERWRKPITIWAVSEDADSAANWGQGWYRGARFTTDAEGLARIRAGYVCLMCVEPHERPFPEECSLCRYPMRKWQTRHLAIEFGGEERIGPSTSLADEAERLDEWGKRNLLWTPGSQVLVPALPKGLARANSR